MGDWIKSTTNMLWGKNISNRAESISVPKFKQELKDEIKDMDSKEIHNLLEIGRQNSSTGYRIKESEMRNNVATKYTQNQINRLEGDTGVTGGKSLGDSKWTSSCDGIVPQ